MLIAPTFTETSPQTRLYLLSNGFTDKQIEAADKILRCSRKFLFITVMGPTPLAICIRCPRERLTISIRTPNHFIVATEDYKEHFETIEDILAAHPNLLNDYYC